MPVLSIFVNGEGSPATFAVTGAPFRLRYSVRRALTDLKKKYVRLAKA